MKNKLGGAANSLKRGYPLFPGNAAPGVLACGLATVLGACAAVPSEPVSNKTDPFAYIAPFETNRMGARDLFLWVSTPQEQGQLTQLQVLCNGQPLDLQPLSQDGAAAGVHAKTGDNVTLVGGSSGAPVKVDLSQLQLSRAPYEAPVPWSTQWYFRLPADSLKCLADADGISLEVRDADGGPDQFTTSGRKNLASLDAFTRR